MIRILERSRIALASLAGAAAALLPGCSPVAVAPADKPAAPVAVAPANPADTPPEVVAAGATAVTGSRASGAATPRAYRQDAASHVYGLNRDRIYKGRLPPLLYAIGTLQVDLDGQGMVRGMNWMRRPSHAPEVVAEIERTVRAAAPYPTPARMGKVVWTDTWLWHKSGRFQLDTLTEGQD
jgi:periplasmic protein TonB